MQVAKSQEDQLCFIFSLRSQVEIMYKHLKISKNAKKHTKFQEKINHSSAIQPFPWWQHEINSVIAVLQGLCLVLFDRMSTSIPPHRSIFVATLVDLQNYWQNTGPSSIVFKKHVLSQTPFGWLPPMTFRRTRPSNLDQCRSKPARFKQRIQILILPKWCSIVPRHIFYKTVLEALWNTS